LQPGSTISFQKKADGERVGVSSSFVSLGLLGTGEVVEMSISSFVWCSDAVGVLHSRNWGTGVEEARVFGCSHAVDTPMGVLDITVESILARNPICPTEGGG
jgi:hypothetical protein